MGVNRRTAALAALAALGAVLVAACSPGVRAAVTLRLYRTRETPRDAHVYIDEEYVGPLGMVIARGVRLPVGEHRITVEKDGYFPWDRLVESDRQPIQLQVELVRIPD